jgi:catechol 2,3-dioxygenase-like lactoylglutathione lyase family enzyme
VPYVISYFTEDLAANRRFYGEVLGLELQSELADVYFLCGSDAVRLQILIRDPTRTGRRATSTGLVLIGVDTQDELDAIRARAEAAGVAEAVGYADPDGRIVLLQVFNRRKPFHD